MSIEIVGKENLPNLYIKEISIDERGPLGILVSVVVYLKDFKDGNSRFQWYDNETLRKNMKLMVVGSNSNRFNQAITSGNYHGALSPRHLRHINGYNPTDVEYKFISIMNLSKEGLTQEPEPTTGGDIYTFGYRCQFIVKNYENYSVFAACVLDTAQFSLESNLDLNYRPISAFHGPIFGEKIFENGIIVSTTNLFFKSDTIYTGPVHKRGDRYMEGSKHSSVPHPALELKTIPNTKIKDYRIEYKAKPPINKLNKRPIFSKLYTSYDKAGSIKGSFHMNMKQFFIQNTEYGGLLLQLNEDLFNSMLGKVRLKSLAITRESVLPATGNTVRRTLSSVEIINTHDYTPYKLRSRYKYYNSQHGRSRVLFSKSRSNSNTDKLQSSIMELHESDSLSIRAFNFSDLSVSWKTGGHYRYKASVEIQDPTSDYIVEMLRELKSGITQFGLYKRKLERRINYDYLLNKTKEPFVKKQMQLDSWVNAVNIYLKYYDLLFDADDTHMESLTNQIISLINPRTATVKSLQRFFSHYQSMANYMMSYFGKSDKMFNEANTRGSVKTGNPDLGKIRIDHVWEDIHNFRKNKCRMTFLPAELKTINSQGDRFPVLLRGEFLKMVSSERNKFWKSPPKFTQEAIPFFKPEHITALNNIQESSYSYFSPSRMFLEERPFDVSSLETIDLFGFNHFFSDFIGRGSRYSHSVNMIQRSNERRAKEVLNRARSSYYIRSPLSLQKNNKEAGKQESDISKHLGKDSGVVTSQKPLTKIGNNILGSKIKNIFSSFESNLTSRERKSRKSFTLDSQESILSLLTKEKRFNPARLIWMPQQIKSLFASKYSFGRSNLLKSNYDLLVNPFTRDFVNLLFFTVGRMEYLSGYGVLSDGTADIRNPRWEVMTPKVYERNKQVLLCRISLYTDNSLKVQETNYDSFNIENQYFYISGRLSFDNISEDNPLLTNRQTDMRKILRRQELASLHPVEYSQSIIIVQNDNKNGPLKNVDYGVEQVQIQDSNDFNKPVGTSDIGDNY
jgi:hypothetical protein